MEKKEKISKEKAKRPGVYQSSEHPGHFKTEGEEYTSDEPETSKPDNDTKDAVDFDKIKGNKK